MSAGPLNEAEACMALHLQELGLHFERQFPYAPPRKFKADFAVWRGGGKWASNVRGGFVTKARRLCLIEVTGGIWTHQAHSSRSGVLKDNERLWYAFLNQWPMVRFTPDQVNSGEAKRLLEGALGR